jgi:hypothetical protein
VSGVAGGACWPPYKRRAYLDKLDKCTSGAVAGPCTGAGAGLIFRQRLSILSSFVSPSASISGSLVKSIISVVALALFSDARGGCRGTF